MLGASAQHAPVQWGILVWTGVTSREYAAKDSKKGHGNESDYCQVRYKNDGNVYREEEESMEEGRIYLLTKVDVIKVIKNQNHTFHVGLISHSSSLLSSLLPKKLIMAAMACSLVMLLLEGFL